MKYKPPIVKKSGWGFWSTFLLLEDYSFQTNILGYHLETEFVTLTPDGLIVLRKGYIFSASGPTWDTPTCRLGALIHDGLYLMLRIGLPPKYREVADQYLFDLCIDQEMNWVRAKRWWIGVRTLGGFSV